MINLVKPISLIGIGSALCCLFLSNHMVFAKDNESIKVSQGIHFIAGSGISHSTGIGATTFPVRAGFLVSNITQIKHRSLNGGVMIEYNGAIRRSSNIPLSAQIIGPAQIYGTSKEGISIEAQFSYALLAQQNTSTQRQSGPYIGISSGIYHRTLEQSTLVSFSSSNSLAATIAPFLNESRWRYRIGSFAGVAIPLPSDKSLLYMDTVVVESRYLHNFGNADLVPGIRRNNQFDLFVSGRWALW